MDLRHIGTVDRPLVVTEDLGGDAGVTSLVQRNMKYIYPAIYLHLPMGVMTFEPNRFLLFYWDDLQNVHL